MGNTDIANHAVMLLLDLLSLQQFVTQSFLELVTLYLMAVDG